MIRKLGQKLEYSGKVVRPGDIIDVLFMDKETCGAKVNSCSAKQVFKLLQSFWPVEKDVFEYKDTIIPFWKLLQWTT